MALKLVNASVIIVARDHNPSILHPSFLRANGVVEPDLALDGDPICTSAIARVPFANGITFIAEPARIQIVDGRPSDSLAGSSLPSYAVKYVETLPHVSYRAVGINFTGLLVTEAPGEAIVAEFLREGPWNDAGLRAQDCGLRLAFEAAPGFLRLSFDPGSVQRSGSSTAERGILIQANYHADVVNREEALPETLRLIGLFPIGGLTIALRSLGFSR